MSLFLSLSLGIILASVFAYIAKLIKQPLIIGYLLAGVAIAASGTLTSEHKNLLEIMSTLGVTFLLFLVGLEMNVRDLPRVGKAAILTGFGQIVFTFIAGFFLVKAFGFNSISAAYLAIALTFSSTIIVVKLLSEKKQLSSLFGRIAVGFLLIQDFVAILLLVFLSSLGSSSISPASFVPIALKGILVVGLIYLFGHFLLHRIIEKIRENQELLFVVSISWALLAASIVSSEFIGFSTEIGGFIAGLALSTFPEHLQISGRVKPLRDFFITLFFLFLGTKLAIGLTPSLIVPSLLLSAFVLIGNPIIVLVIMGLLGFRKRTSFLAAITVAQISEFSFIVIALGERLGHIDAPIVGIVTIVGVITMTISSYLILNAESIYSALKGILVIFEREKTHESAFVPQKILKDHLVLIGADRTGERLLPILQRRKEEILVVDFNPKIIEKLSGIERVEVMYGDIGDPELQEVINLPQAKLIISTVNEMKENLSILERIKGRGNNKLTIFVAETPKDAVKLYETGASYVIVPKYMSGDHLAHTLHAHGLRKEYFEKLKERDFNRYAKER